MHQQNLLYFTILWKTCGNPVDKMWKTTKTPDITGYSKKNNNLTISPPFPLLISDILLAPGFFYDFPQYGISTKHQQH
jgi:hypothetical protein